MCLPARQERESERVRGTGGERGRDSERGGEQTGRERGRGRKQERERERDGEKERQSQRERERERYLITALLLKPRSCNLQPFRAGLRKHSQRAASYNPQFEYKTIFMTRKERVDRQLSDCRNRTDQ